METPGLRYLTAEFGRLLTTGAKMIFVAGPRQVGKTTFVRHLLGEAGAEPLYFNWDIETHRRLLIRHPGDFWQRIERRAAEDLGVNFGTVRGWIEAMSRLYYLFTIRPYPGRLARTLRSAEKAYLYDPTEIESPGARFENIVALHLRKLVDAWVDRGDGDFALHYVRDREKREVDFLITESRKPYALIEAKLSSRDPDASLRYFSERLKPRYAVQVVRHPEGFRSTLTTRGVILTPARRIPCAGVMPTSAGERPRRNSLRLEGFDYSQSGEYFVTMCTAGRRCVPGEVEEGRMRLSDTGKIVDACRRRIPEHFPKTRVSTYQIMPNPVHVLRQPTCRSGHIQQLHVHAPAPPHT